MKENKDKKEAESNTISKAPSNKDLNELTVEEEYEARFQNQNDENIDEDRREAQQNARIRREQERRLKALYEARMKFGQESNIHEE